MKTDLDAMPVVRIVPKGYGPLSEPYQWDGHYLRVHVPRGRLFAPSIQRAGLYGIIVEIPAPIAPGMPWDILRWYRWVPVAVSADGSPFIEMDLQFYANRLHRMDPCPACGYMLTEERLTRFQGSILSCSKSGHLFPKVTT